MEVKTLRANPNTSGRGNAIGFTKLEIGGIQVDNCVISHSDYNEKGRLTFPTRLGKDRKGKDVWYPIVNIPDRVTFKQVEQDAVNGYHAIVRTAANAPKANTSANDAQSKLSK